MADPIRNDSVLADILIDVVKLDHSNGNAFNGGGRYQGWWIKKGGKLWGKRSPIPKHRLQGSWERPGIGTILADGTKLKAGETYPCQDEEGRACNWIPAEGDTELHPFKTFPDATEAAKRQFGIEGWKRAKGNHFGTTWFPEDTPKPESGPNWSVAGAPCETTVFSAERGSIGHPCLRLIDRDGKCKLHANVVERHKQWSEDWNVKYEADRAASKREIESKQRGEEILEELQQALEELHLRPELFEYVSGGRLSCPAETLRTLVEKALEFEAMKEM